MRTPRNKRIAYKTMFCAVRSYPEVEAGWPALFLDTESMSHSKEEALIKADKKDKLIPDWQADYPVYEIREVHLKPLKK